MSIGIPLVQPTGHPLKTSEDETLEYIDMPNEMSVFEIGQQVYEWDDSVDLSACKQLIGLVADALKTYQVGTSGVRFTVMTLDNTNRTFLNQMLGEGEVGVTMQQPDGAVHIQESVFTGLWRVIRLDNRGSIVEDYVEIAAIPDVVLLHQRHLPEQVQVDIDDVPDEVINALPILTELKDKRAIMAVNQNQGKVDVPLPDAGVINLTLLPHTEADVAFIQQALGIGDTVILSRGYGNCRIQSTGVSSVWLVQYFNSSDNQILSTIDVVDIPEVACAAQEDIIASHERLHEFMVEV